MHVRATRAIIFKLAQTIWPQYFNVRDRQTNDLLWQYCALHSIAR